MLGETGTFIYPGQAQRTYKYLIYNSNNQSLFLETSRTWALQKSPSAVPKNLQKSLCLST